MKIMSWRIRLLSGCSAVWTCCKSSLYQAL